MISPTNGNSSGVSENTTANTITTNTTNSNDIVRNQHYQDADILSQQSISPLHSRLGNDYPPSTFSSSSILSTASDNAFQSYCLSQPPSASNVWYSWFGYFPWILLLLFGGCAMVITGLLLRGEHSQGKEDERTVGYSSKPFSFSSSKLQKSELHELHEWDEQYQRVHDSRSAPNFDVLDKERVNHQSPSVSTERHSTFHEGGGEMNGQSNKGSMVGTNKHSGVDGFRSSSSLHAKSPSIREEEDVFIIEDVEESEDDSSESMFHVGSYSEQRNRNKDYELDFEEIEDNKVSQSFSSRSFQSSPLSSPPSSIYQETILDFDITTPSSSSSSSSSSSPTIASLLLLPILFLRMYILPNDSHYTF